MAQEGTVLQHPAWMDQRQQELDIRKGDRVTIHHPLYGDFTGTVLMADPGRRQGYVTTWYIELKEDRTGYTYWKQGYRDRAEDGGWVEVKK